EGFLVFPAHGFDQLCVGEELHRHRDGPRPRIRTRIVEGDLDIEMTEIAPAVALDQAESFGVWMAVVIEPRALGEAAGFDDQGVAVPASHGISHPNRIR